MVTNSFFFFNVQWTLSFLLASCPTRGCPTSAAFNAFKLWWCWSQTWLCHSQSCGWWSFGWLVRRGSCPGRQQVWSPPHLPVGHGRWQSQPPAWPWCSAGPHTSRPSTAPLSRSGPALTAGTVGSHWVVPSAWHSASPPPSGCSPNWPSDSSLSPDQSLRTGPYISAQWVSSQQFLSQWSVRWSLWYSPQSAGIRTCLALLSSLEPARHTGPRYLPWFAKVGFTWNVY